MRTELKPQIAADERRSAINAKTERILSAAFRVSNVLGCGFLEKVYENALAYELRKCGFDVQQQYFVTVRYDGVIVGEGRNYVVLQSDPTAHSELLAVRDAARRLGTRDLSQCDVYSTATPCAMCQGALYWGRIRRVFTEHGAAEGVAPKLGC